MNEAIQNLAEKLLKNKQIAEFVRMLQPFDLVIALAQQGLSARDASRVAIELVKMSETSMGFPDGPNKDHFPPPSRGEPAEWPYDAMTIAAQDPSTRGRKRGLMNSRQPGIPAPGISGAGTQIKSPPHNNTGSDKDWGRSSGTFDLPGEEPSNLYLPEDGANEDDNLFTKDLPVGRPIPRFFGGRNPGPRKGF